MNDMNTIRALLERFMAGQTSRQEEQRLADWFRDHPQVDGDLEPYRLMFAYFDEGMPRQTIAKRRKPWLYVALAVAASLALVVTLVWPSDPVATPPVAMTQPATPADTLATPAPPAMKADSLPVKEETEKTTDHYRRHRFTPAHPKVLLADATPEAEPLRVSVSEAEPECENVHLAAWPLTEAERQAISIIGEQRAEEALRQLELAQQRFLENALDTLNRQMQLAGLDDTDDDVQDVY